MNETHEALFSVPVSERFAPKNEDWGQLQGGKPRVVHVRGEIFNITHDYENGSRAIVPTFRPESYGSGRIWMKDFRI